MRFPNILQFFSGICFGKLFSIRTLISRYSCANGCGTTRSERVLDAEWMWQALLWIFQRAVLFLSIIACRWWSPYALSSVALNESNVNKWHGWYTKQNVYRTYKHTHSHQMKRTDIAIHSGFSSFEFWFKSKDRENRGKKWNKPTSHFRCIDRKSANTTNKSLGIYSNMPSNICVIDVFVWV